MEITIPEAFTPILESNKRFRVCVGGRGSGKSMTVGMLMLVECVRGKRIMCLREFQNSIKESVHSLLTKLIAQLDLPGFTITHDKISHDSGGEFTFMGLARNIESVKSMDGYHLAWVEEGQTISEESLRLLTPTIREAGSYIIFTANPRSMADPFTERFLKDKFSELRDKKLVEDDLHTIIMANYTENPYFPAELEQERLYDLKNMSAAVYAHTWEGATLDAVENCLIESDWFDAALQISEKIKYRASGAKVVAHDVSDTGRDAKSVVVRHGARVLSLGLMHTGTASDGLDWALRYVDDHAADSFIWDSDGIGLGLAREVERSLGNRNVNFSGFRGGESPRDPQAMYDGHRMNRDAFYNRKAQAYWDLRMRFVRTYQAMQGEYMDPDELIFLDPNDPMIPQLRSELCRLPLKPNANGKVQIVPKTELAKPPFNLPSPNLADALMMSFHVQDFVAGTWSQPIEYREAAYI